MARNNKKEQRGTGNSNNFQKERRKLKKNESNQV